MSRVGLSPGEVGALLPLEWVPAQAPDAATLSAEAQNATRRLGLLLTFEEVFAKSYPGSSDASGELAPLAARVNWLLDWVLANHPPEPAWFHFPRSVILTLTDVRWCESRPLPLQQWGMLHFYPEPRLPWPVVFWAQIEEVGPVEGGWDIRAQWRGQSDESIGLLEKLLFRLHRREVARARQSE